MTINTDCKVCTFCNFEYPGADGSMSTACTFCTGGRIAYLATTCSTCLRTAHADSITPDQAKRMQQRGIVDWRAYIEKAARAVETWTWWVGPVTFVQGAEFAMQVVIRKVVFGKALSKHWVDVAMRESLSALSVAPSKCPLAIKNFKWLFAHLNKTLDCLQETKGEFTSNDLLAKARTHLAKTLKARIEFDSQTETFDVATLKVGDFKEDVSSMDTKELREKLLKNGVLAEGKKKRNREPRAEAVNVLNVRTTKTTKKVKGSRAGAQSEEEDDMEGDVIETAAPLAKCAATAPMQTLAKDPHSPHSEGDVVKTVAPAATPSQGPVSVLKPKPRVVVQTPAEHEAQCFEKLCLGLKRRIEKVPADGHCLFHALARAVPGFKSFQELRNLAADELEKDEEIMAFLQIPDTQKQLKNGKPVFSKDGKELLLDSRGEDSGNAKRYLREVRGEKFGGDFELFVLSKALKTKIEVYEMLGLRCCYPSESSYGKLDWPIVKLSYHKHLFNAAHYQLLVV